MVPRTLPGSPGSTHAWAGRLFAVLVTVEPKQLCLTYIPAFATSNIHIFSPRSPRPPGPLNHSCYSFSLLHSNSARGARGGVAWKWTLLFTVLLCVCTCRHHKGHTCDRQYCVVSIVLWEGLSSQRSSLVYRQLTDLLPKYGNPTQRRCESNERSVIENKTIVNREIFMLITYIEFLSFRSVNLERIEYSFWAKFETE